MKLTRAHPTATFDPIQPFEEKPSNVHLARLIRLNSKRRPARVAELQSANKSHLMNNDLARLTAPTQASQLPTAPQHRFWMKALISVGSEKMTNARSPLMLARRIAGLPFSGPNSLESVLKRRLNSQNVNVPPAAIVT